MSRVESSNLISDHQSSGLETDQREMNHGYFCAGSSETVMGHSGHVVGNYLPVYSMQ